MVSLTNIDIINKHNHRYLFVIVHELDFLFIIIIISLLLCPTAGQRPPPFDFHSSRFGATAFQSLYTRPSHPASLYWNASLSLTVLWHPSSGCVSTSLWLHTTEKSSPAPFVVLFLCIKCSSNGNEIHRDHDI